ncbi:MAG: hypothetical protein JSR28_01620 [Proteobacteria bacterium]|nr:hypothetical protein [Pseudomonadota bacterium]
MFIDLTKYPHLTSSKYLPLLRNCHRARYAQLVSPEEVAEIVADAGIDGAPAGWVIHAELSKEDIEHLTQNRTPQSRLVVQEFNDGLPAVIFTIQIQGLRFQWAVPMWENDAQLWLRDAVERGRIALMFSAFDDSASVTFVTGACALPHPEALLEAAAVQKPPVGDAHLFYILNAGMRLMNDDSAQFAPTQEPPQEIRVMVAGRGANAVRLIGTFVAAAEVAQALSAKASEVIQ